MNPVDLAFTPALEQARLVRDRIVSPLELTQLYLDRIEALNPSLHSYCLVMAEQALADAKLKTEFLAGTSSSPVNDLPFDRDNLPPFFGVPISIKDLTAVAGVPCAYGVKILKNRMATEDEGIVTRIRNAGFVILGKTSTPELGSTPYTEPKGFPPTRNPWNLDYTPGGSSGGASSAVAAGLCAIAQGTDGGGSIRGPAFCCGIVGIKPSRGRVSHEPVGDKLSGLATDGPLARTVTDAAAMLDVIAGHQIGDPYWAPDPPYTFLEATKRSLPALKIGFITAFPPLGTVHQLCEAAVRQTAQRLEAMGHAVEPTELDFTDIIDPLIAVWQAGVDMGVPGLVLGKLTRWLLRRSRSRSGGDYLRAVMKMQAVCRQYVRQLDAYDAVVMPIFMHPTIRVGEWAKLRPAKAFEKVVNWVAPSPPINATGQPSIAIPTGFTPEGLPIGVQIVGRPADDLTVIGLAAALEQAYPWIQHRPQFATEE